MKILRRHLFTHFANYAPDDDKGGGGGAGGGGKDEDLEERMGRMVNASVTSQISRKLDAAISTAIAPLLEKIEKLTAGPPPDDKKGKDEGSAELRALQAQIDALQAQNKEKDDNSKATTKKHREEQLVAQIREGLTQAGVKKELMDGAVATFRSKMTINEETGEATYKKQNKGWSEDLDVSGGLKDWVGSDTGKAHLAPLPGGGAGTTPVTHVRGASALNPATLPADPKERQAAIKAHKIAEAKKALRHHTSELMSGGRIQISGPAPGEGEG